jgi:hypothetical protein
MIYFLCMLRQQARINKKMPTAAKAVLPNSAAKLQHFSRTPTYSPQKVATSAKKDAEPSSTLRLAIQSLNPVLYVYIKYYSTFALQRHTLHL